MILVDELRVWPNARHRCFKSGSAHLATDDGDMEALHTFAKRLGLKRVWFQDHRLVPHYDLSPAKHSDAISAGAELVTPRELLRRCRRAPSSAHGNRGQ